MCGTETNQRGGIITGPSLQENSIGLAWHCEERPDLSGTTTLATTAPSPLRAKLFGLLEALNQINYMSRPPPLPKVRLLTDSHAAIREFSMNYSHHPTVHHIKDMVNLLGRTESSKCDSGM